MSVLTHDATRLIASSGRVVPAPGKFLTMHFAIPGYSRTQACDGRTHSLPLVVAPDNALYELCRRCRKLADAAAQQAAVANSPAL